jgi:UDP-N-acetylmuramate-alanine ligase
MTHAVLSLLKESKHPMRIDLIGVAGSGMSGLAWLLIALGHRVSGSDKATTLETERLQKAGLQFFPQHTEREVEDCDMVIYSSAIKPGNESYDAAYKQGIPLVRRAEALAAVMAGKKGVVVAGFMRGHWSISRCGVRSMRNQSGLSTLNTCAQSDMSQGEFP